MAPELSFEEKVDYIYKELKGQKRARFLHFFFKLSIIIIFILSIYNINRLLKNEAVITRISSNIGTIVKPIVQDLIQNQIKGTINTSENQQIINKTAKKG